MVCPSEQLCEVHPCCRGPADWQCGVRRPNDRLPDMETRSNRLMNVDWQMQVTCSYSWLNTSQCLSGRVAMPQQHTLLHVLWRTNHHTSKSLWADVGWASPSVIFRKCRGVRVSVRGSCSHVKMALM